MAYTAGFTAVTGATFTAAQYNTNVRDNFSAIWVGTTAGDIDYYTSSTTKTRLAIGAAGESLVVAAGVPSWRKPAGVVDVSGMAERTSAAAMTNTTWADVTSLSVTLVLTRTCTVYAMLGGTLAGDGTQNTKVRSNIDGTAQTADTSSNSTISGAQVPLPVTWRRTGIAAGSRIVKIQAQNDTANNYYIQGVLIAWAMVE